MVQSAAGRCARPRRRLLASWSVTIRRLSLDEAIATQATSLEGCRDIAGCDFRQDQGAKCLLNRQELRRRSAANGKCFIRERNCQPSERMENRSAQPGWPHVTGPAKRKRRSPGPIAGKRHRTDGSYAPAGTRARLRYRFGDLARRVRLEHGLAPPPRYAPATRSRTADAFPKSRQPQPVVALAALSLFGNGREDSWQL